MGLSLHLIPDHHSVKHCSHILYTSEALCHHSVKQCSHIVHTLTGFTSSQCQTVLTHCAYPQRLFIIRVSNSAHTSCKPSEVFHHQSVKQCSYIVHTIKGFSSAICLRQRCALTYPCVPDMMLKSTINLLTPGVRE